jgi:hypothetical protein
MRPGWTERKWPAMECDSSRTFPFPRTASSRSLTHVLMAVIILPWPFAPSRPGSGPEVSGLSRKAAPGWESLRPLWVCWAGRVAPDCLLCAGLPPFCHQPTPQSATIPGADPSLPASEMHGGRGQQGAMPGVPGGY